MTRPVGPVVLLAMLCGVLGGLAGGWFIARDPGAGRGVPGTLRQALDAAEASALEARAAQAAATAALLARVEALERRHGERTAAGGEAAAAADDLRALRDAVVRDLATADARLASLERRVDELAALIALAPPAPSGDGPPTEEEERVWVNLARDADPVRRFSALAMLGRARTDRSVQASVEALGDPAEIVVWQAVRNVGRFEERAAARELARLLSHESVMVRNAAWEALLRLGAPDTGFRATATPEARRAPAEAAERWAAESQ